MAGYKKGDRAYIIVSNNDIMEVIVINHINDLYTIRLSSKGAIRLKSGRLYQTEQEAKKALRKQENNTRVDFWENMGPYKYLQ